MEGDSGSMGGAWSPPETQYARSGDFSIAFQALGDGPIDLVFIPGFVSNLELTWDWPPLGAFYRAFTAFARVILFDKRGTGLSDRVQADADDGGADGRPPRSDGRERLRASRGRRHLRRRAARDLVHRCAPGTGRSADPLRAASESDTNRRLSVGAAGGVVGGRQPGSSSSRGAAPSTCTPTSPGERPARAATKPSSAGGASIADSARVRAPRPTSRG